MHVPQNANYACQIHYQKKLFELNYALAILEIKHNLDYFSLACTTNCEITCPHFTNVEILPIYIK